MESEMNENWGQEQEQGQGQMGGEQPQQPAESSFFQSPWMQRSFLNIKVSTWVKCVIIITVLSLVAVVVAPTFTSANSQQDSTICTEADDDWYNYEYDYGYDSDYDDYDY